MQEPLNSSFILDVPSWQDPWLFNLCRTCKNLLFLCCFNPKLQVSPSLCLVTFIPQVLRGLGNLFTTMMSLGKGTVIYHTIGIISSIIC
jgi:hypothetical protein